MKIKAVVGFKSDEWARVEAFVSYTPPLGRMGLQLELRPCLRIAYNDGAVDHVPLSDVLAGAYEVDHEHLFYPLREPGAGHVAAMGRRLAMRIAVRRELFKIWPRESEWPVPWEDVAPSVDDWANLDYLPEQIVLLIAQCVEIAERERCPPCVEEEAR